VRGYYIEGVPPGAGDLSGILADGRRLEIEVKSAKGEQGEAQVRWQAMIEKFGGVYILARSVAEAMGRLP
jgi:hypothetical protein